MPVTTGKITPFLWFDSAAEEAAKFYVSVFKNSSSERSVATERKASRCTAGRRERS